MDSIYYLNNMSTIHLNKVAFTRNRLMKSLLVMVSSSSAKIQNNTLTGNNASHAVYYLERMNTINLTNVTFIQNKFRQNLLHVV